MIMKWVYQKYQLFLIILNRLGTWLCMGCIAALVVVTGVQVFSRYFLNMPPVWAESSCMLLILTVAFIGGSLCVREDLHLSLMYFVTRLSGRWKRITNVLVVLMILAFGGTLLVGGIKTTVQVWEVRDPTLPIPRGSYYLPLALAGLLIVLFQIEKLVSALGEFRSSAKEMD